MNENKKRKFSVDLNLASNSQSKKVNLIVDDKNNQIKNEFDNDWDYPDMDFDFLEASKENILDLSDFKRCIVENVSREKQDMILILKEDRTSSKATCRIKGTWSQLDIKVKDMISVKGVWNSNLGSYIVSTEEGIVVTNPDHLVSGTSVVGSLFCKRKAILSERFRGLDSNNKIMTIGSLVHELFQICLRQEINTIKDIKSTIGNLLLSKETTMMLYTSHMTMDEARLELNIFIPKIYSFVNRYITGQNSNKTKSDEFSGSIDSIQDIEENIWVPQLGLKGKVDVSVNIKDRNKRIIEHVPLELKTGKATFSNEHTGQLIIYQMMMSQVGKKVDSGLLLYLRDGVMKDVTSTRHSQRDLIMLRNDLSNYSLKQLPEIHDKKIGIPVLPAPINHHSACRTCQYNVVCTAYLQKDVNTKLSVSHPLNEVSEDCLSHLNDDYMEYFIHWTGLVALEVEESRKDNQLKSIWTDTPDKRQKQGRALINLEIDGLLIGDITSSLIHVFRSINKIDFNLSGFCSGEYLVVSTKNRIAISAGKVQSVTKEIITVMLDRNLTKLYPNSLFILDKYDSEVNGTFNMTNLGALLDNRESSDRLRKIIIDKIKPTFETKLPNILLTSEGEEIVSTLNVLQHRAVSRAIAANDYLLIKGLPGSGKTETLVALIRILNLMGKTVLVTSHTHSAVDNILTRLLKHKVEFLRLGTSSKINPKLLQHSESALLSQCKTPSDIHNLYSKYKIVGVTCLGSSHPIMSQREFDICLVDEATQVYQPSVIRPLLNAKKFVLVGDPDQLPPIVKSSEAKILGANESLFARLDSTDSTVVLTHQYRMNKTITQLANSVTYKGTLLCANETIAESVFKITNLKRINEIYNTERWLEACLSTHINLSVYMLNTGNVFERNKLYSNKKDDEKSLSDNSGFIKEKKKFYKNYFEASLAIYLIKVLIEGGVKPETIGVIAPFKAQVDLLKELLNNNKTMNVEVNTVDQFQGRDKEIIIYCCTKTNESQFDTSPAHHDEILEDQRRLTVAITRSKYKLIIIGDLLSLEKYTPYKKLFKNIGSLSKNLLVEGKMGFHWENMVQYMERMVQSNRGI